MTQADTHFLGDRVLNIGSSHAAQLTDEFVEPEALENELLLICQSKSADEV